MLIFPSLTDTTDTNEAMNTTTNTRATEAEWDAFLGLDTPEKKARAEASERRSYLLSCILNYCSEDGPIDVLHGWKAELELLRAAAA